MSYTQVGACPHCGAPIYVPQVWHGTMPPPPVYSCECVPHSTTYATTCTSEEKKDTMS